VLTIIWLEALTIASAIGIAALRGKK